MSDRHDIFSEESLRICRAHIKTAARIVEDSIAKIALLGPIGQKRAFVFWHFYDFYVGGQICCPIKVTVACPR
jgi:hypothetical protein